MISKFIFIFIFVTLCIVDIIAAPPKADQPPPGKADV